MPTVERRNPVNAKLREKIDQIKQISLQLQGLIEQVQTETITWARQGKVSDFPCQNFADHLSPAFRQQRAALDQIQQQIRGKSLLVSLITDEERAALMA
jgi:hypothetical protein